MQLSQQQLLQQAMSGQISLPPGISPQAVGGYLMKQAGLNSNQLSNSPSILQRVSTFVFKQTTFNKKN